MRLATPSGVGERVVAHGGARFAVEVAGEGPPVLCLHAGVCDRRMWRSTDIGGRRIAWDRRGFGDTTADDTPYSAVDDALAVADAVGAERAVWMGCSQGGRIALDVALAHPERVEALVLVAPAVSGAPDDDSGLDPAVLDAYRAADAAGGEELVAFETWFWLDGPESPRGRVGGDARALVDDMNRRHITHPPVGAEVPPPSAWDRIEGVGVRVVLVWGDLDAAPLRRRFEALAVRLPRVVSVVLRGAAHLPSVEAPARFDAAVVAALASMGA